MHITSLPSRGGVGTLGRAAYDFVDFVKSAGMNIWQMLPVGPTGFAESPYQSASTYAGNPLMIDFDLMTADGLLPEGAYVPLPQKAQVDFDAVKRQNGILKNCLMKKKIINCQQRIFRLRLVFPVMHGERFFIQLEYAERQAFLLFIQPEIVPETAGNIVSKPFGIHRKRNIKFLKRTIDIVCLHEILHLE